MTVVDRAGSARRAPARRPARHAHPSIALATAPGTPTPGTHSPVRVRSIVPSDPVRSTFVFWATCFVALLVSLLTGWFLFDLLGGAARTEQLVGDMLGAERFEFSAPAIVLVVAALSVVGATAATLFAAAALFVCNAVTRRCGGVVLDLADGS